MKTAAKAPSTIKAAVQAEPSHGNLDHRAINPLWNMIALGAQAKLTVSAPDDPLEHEADSMADQIMRMPEPQIQRKCSACFNGSSPNDEEEQQPLVQRRAEPSPQPAQVSSNFASNLGSGRPLDAGARSFFEPRFGQDFSLVRVHADRQAEQAARSINAKAFTYGNHIVFGSAQHMPNSREGRQLLAHELTHVIQQSCMGGIQDVSSQGFSGPLQRTPAEADALISQHTSWGNLDETQLGRELLRLVLSDQLTLADEVLNALGSTDRDDVAYEFMLVVTDEQLMRFVTVTASRQFLQRLFDELTAGSVAGEEQQQADRILRVTASQTVSVSAFEAAATSSRTKIFPFRLPGLTVLHDAPIEARRERGGVWVHSFVRVLGTDEFRTETATLPTEYFLSGIVLPETEVIGVRLYDQGGFIHYTTPLFLIQLANATNQQVLEKILEAAGIGLTLGTGALAGLGVEATMAARVLLWADRAAFVLGTITSVLREHRSWIVQEFGSEFMDAIDIVHSAVAIYGLARIAIEGPRLILNLRNSYRAFREAAQSRSSGFSSAEQGTVQEITQSTDELIEQIDNIQGARTSSPSSTTETPTAHTPLAEPRPTEPAPVASTGREPLPERASSAPEAPAATAPGGGSYHPTQAELDRYADRAWRILGGRGPRPAVVETPLPSGTAGQYLSSPSTIEVGTGASSPGSVIDTVWHEASHGRIRELIGFMNEHLGGSWQRTLLRPLDEIVSYFIGGLGRLIEGPTLSSRLYGILEMLGAPITAVGSMATTAERALWVAHMLAFAAALIWAEIQILLAIRESRDTGTSQSTPAP